MKRISSKIPYPFITALIMVLSAILTSCANTEYSDPVFSGGETLTPEIMESIRDHIYASETEKYPVVTDGNGNPVVYWVSGGSVWHYNPDCSSIRNSSGVISGTAEDAVSAGKAHPCSKCSPPALRVSPVDTATDTIKPN